MCPHPYRWMGVRARLVPLWTAPGRAHPGPVRTPHWRTVTPSVLPSKSPGLQRFNYAASTPQTVQRAEPSKKSIEFARRGVQARQRHGSCSCRSRTSCDWVKSCKAALNERNLNWPTLPVLTDVRLQIQELKDPLARASNSDFRVRVELGIAAVPN